jgi:serine protease Do
LGAAAAVASRGGLAAQPRPTARIIINVATRRFIRFLTCDIVAVSGMLEANVVKRQLLALASIVFGATTALLAQDVPVATTAPSINLRKTVTVDVVQKTKDAVVYVNTSKMIRTSPFGDDPFFRNLMPPQSVQVTSLGSGFIIHEDGYCVTNNHVIDRAREIVVDLPDGRKLDADLVAADPDNDIAILKLKSDKPLPYLELGDSSDLLIGEPVIAVGNPLGYSHSVSTGIVSAIHRKLEDPRIKLEDLIQTDAAINPGNSGGPLLNAYGQVIGINTAIRGDAQNIGFAIQVNRLRDLIPSLLDPQQAAKVELPLKLAERRKVTSPATVTSEVVSFAGEQRLVVATINGTRPRNIVDAYAMILRIKAGGELTLGFADGSSQKLVAKALAPPDAIGQAKTRLGIVVEALSPMVAQKYGVEIEAGMLVTQVTRGSAADQAGVKIGDVIVGVGRYPINTMEDFAMLLQALPTNGQVRVQVVRGDQQGYLRLRLGATPATP